MGYLTIRFSADYRAARDFIAQIGARRRENRRLSDDRSGEDFIIAEVRRRFNIETNRTRLTSIYGSSDGRLKIPMDLWAISQVIIEEVKKDPELRAEAERRQTKSARIPCLEILFPRLLATLDALKSNDDRAATLLSRLIALDDDCPVAP